MTKPSDVAKTAEDRAKIQQQLAQIYTPGVPITDPALFSGRQRLLSDLRLELPVAGRNFVLYGERGVGKTSFYNVLLHGFSVERHNCSKQDDFVTIFLNILGKRGEQFTDADHELLAKAGYKIGGDKLFVTVEGGDRSQSQGSPGRPTPTRPQFRTQQASPSPGRGPSHCPGRVSKHRGPRGSNCHHRGRERSF